MRILVFIDGSGSGKYAAEFPDVNYVEQITEPGYSHNDAEYMALILALRHMERDKQYAVKSDSKLVVEQWHGRWKINKDKFVAYKLLCETMAEDLDFTLEWIPREQNSADALLR